MSRQLSLSKKYRRYSPSKMDAALRMVDEGMSKKKAAEITGIPRTTLQDKLSGRSPVGSNPGRKTTLSAAEENVLVDYCLLVAKIGYPLQRHELLQEVKKVLDHDGRVTPFRNNLPGKDWYSGFRARHPEVAERSAATLGHQRSVINNEMIKGWFTALKEFMSTEIDDYQDILKDPRRFFNADESGFPLCVNSGKVLAEKGVRHVYQVATSNKQQITVMACFNAFGDYMPPLIVYPGQRFRDHGIEAFPEAIYGHTENGWMDSALFLSFLKELNDFVSSKSITKPILLFVDGHSTHMSLDACQFCFDNQIILYCLLPNATHVLQPCDVGFFGPLKSSWKRYVKEWHLAHLGQIFIKRNFAEVFCKAWRDVTKIENAIHGFKRCGLFPLEPANVDQSKLHPSEITSVSKKNENTVQKAKDDPASNPVQGSNQPDTSISDNLADNNEAPLQSRNHSLSPVEIRTDRESQMSESFSLLTVPEIKKKKPTERLRDTLPKALSGTKALQMLKDRQLAKEAAEAAKQKRKEEREAKKAQKQAEQEERRKIREEKKKGKKRRRNSKKMQ